MAHSRTAQPVHCPLEHGLSIFGGKWKARIICVLAEKSPMRYSDIRRNMVNITDAVLANTLKDLIASGMAEREQYDEIPPRVLYRITFKGISVFPIIRRICSWSAAHDEPWSRLNMQPAFEHCLNCRYRLAAAGCSASRPEA